MDRSRRKAAAQPESLEKCPERGIRAGQTMAISAGNEAEIRVGVQLPEKRRGAIDLFSDGL